MLSGTVIRVAFWKRHEVTARSTLDLPSDCLLDCIRLVLIILCKFWICAVLDSLLSTFLTTLDQLELFYFKLRKCSFLISMIWPFWEMHRRVLL